MFTRVGEILYPLAAASADTVFEAALDAGADNIESGEETHEIRTSVDGFAAVRDALEKKFGPPRSAKLVWRAQNTTPVANEENAKTLFELIEALEDNDDVQTVYTNEDVPEAIVAKLGAAS
jgi:transcriptional/translational regulatory protein YebC/TACO1